MTNSQLTCPHCGQSVGVFLGPTASAVPCPNCRGTIEIPSTAREEFWADKVKRLKAQGLSNEVIRESRKNIPYPAAFREIAIAVRKDIRARRKEGRDTKDLLCKLYKWAVTENLFMDLEWSKIVTERILHSTARSCIKGLKAPYDIIGYQNLALLNKTDVKWLVEAFGEPARHSTAREANPELWQRAVNAFREAEGKDEQHFWRSHGFDGPPEEVRRSSTSSSVPGAVETRPNSGCLGVVICVVLGAVLVYVLSGCG